MAGVKTAYIGLGSNLGDRLGNLRRARILLADTPGIELRRSSSLYETEPWGVAGQPLYLNAVVEVETGLSPGGLLEVFRQVEWQLGRRRGGRWAPRTIDCDLLLLARDVIVEEGLVVPHPHLTRRAFVLVPLLELAPDLRHPVTGLSLAVHLEMLGPRGVHELEGIKW